MSLLNVALWLAGVALLAAAYLRGRPYLERYQALTAQEDNIRRYESWRGRSLEPPGPSSADLMRAELRRRLQTWVGVGIAGAVLVVLGFAVR
jgi:hypothetical protein